MTSTDILMTLSRLWWTTGLVELTPDVAAMLGLGILLLYLGVRMEFEPLLLVPIGFGTILVNLPGTGLMGSDGLLRFFYQGIATQVLPPLIFLGLGALTDFRPLLRRPSAMLLGIAAQLGIFATLLGSLGLGFSLPSASAIGIIGGADGPTAIFVSAALAPEYLGAIAVAAYSYMALVPIIQPPIIRALTTRSERALEMSDDGQVSSQVELWFPVVTLLVTVLVVPGAAPLIGMLMLGNFLRVCGVVERLAQSAQEEIVNVITLALGLAVGASLTADQFWQVETLGILVMGAVAFGLATAFGVLVGKVMNLLSSEPVNPILGAAGVSAVPMAARVVQKVGREANSDNHLIMIAMGANVSGVIGSALAAGVLLALVG